MPKIQSLVHPYATESTVLDLVNAVNKATPSNIIPAAQVIRDASGKLVSVDVNLPVGLAKADLANALLSVQSNPNVVVASSFPLDLNESFNTNVWTDGQLITQLTSPELKIPLLPTDGGCVFKATTATEGYTGVGRALILKDEASASSGQTDIFGGTNRFLMKGQMRLDSVNAGLASTGAYSLAFRIKMPSTPSTAPGGKFKIIRLDCIHAGHPGEVYFSGNDGTWTMNIATPAMNYVQTTTVATGSWALLKYNLSSDGVTSLSVNDQPGLSVAKGYLQPSTEMWLQIAQLDDRESEATLVQDPFMFDDIAYSIKSGTLL